MKNSILSKKINITLICVLAFIYLGCASVSILGIDSTNFYYKNQFDSVEILSAVIFIVSIIIGLKDIRLYVVFMVFNILALPSSVDNFAPSILISAYTDLRQVYFPIITHTDIYLLLGIIKFWDRYSNRTLNFKGFQLKFFFGLLLFLTISITGNIVKHVNLYDTGLILSHSYHLRYLLLLTLLFGNTPIINYRKQMFMGCIAAVVFLILESLLYSCFFHPLSRLTSGTLGNNVFANILASFSCYYLFLIIRKHISLRYSLLVLIIIFGIVLTKTRSALLLLVAYFMFEVVTYIFVLCKVKSKFKLSYLIFIVPSLIFISFFYFTQNERLSLNNFKVENINFSAKGLNKILVLEENDFNASLILRLNHFQTSLNMIQHNPIIGIGPGRWNRYKKQYGSTEINLMDSHNDILATTSQYGLLTGLFLCFVIYFLPLFIFVKMKKDSIILNNKMKYLFLISFVMTFAGLTNTGLFKHQIFGFLSLILVLAIFNTNHSNFNK
jgi:O-antigen ligase